MMTAMPTGATPEGPSATPPTPMRMKLTGAEMVAPGTAAIMEAIANEAGMSGKMAWTSAPAVPPMNKMGNTVPPRKPTSWAEGHRHHLAEQHGDQQAGPEGGHVVGGIAELARSARCREGKRERYQIR